MPEPNSPPENAAAELCGDDLDAPLAALLARGAQDTGEATETVRLDTLTESEKRVLLALLQARMGTPPPPIGDLGEKTFPPKNEEVQ